MNQDGWRCRNGDVQSVQETPAWCMEKMEAAASGAKPVG